MDRIIDLIKQDEQRLAALACVQQLHLPQCYIAAGFVRNLVWDHLHQKQKPTPLNDVDVIYFDNTQIDPTEQYVLEERLNILMPNLTWQVRNQAFMHVRNGDQPYLSTIDAMNYWVEKETAVAIRQIGLQQFECIAAFGVESLFQNKITHNPKREIKTFHDRVQAKGWLQHWSNLYIVT